VEGRRRPESKGCRTRRREPGHQHAGRQQSGKHQGPSPDFEDARVHSGLVPAKFDSLRNAVKQPMTSKEFYFAISPIIASVRQGHMTMSQVPYKLSKKEAKRIKKAGDGPLSQFAYEWFDNKLYVIKNKSKNDKIKVGTEIVSINKITPQELHSKYRKTYTSDGFNTTFLPKIFSKRYITFMTNEIGINDSLTFVFKEKDSLFSQVISRKKPEQKNKTKVADSVKVDAKPIVDKAKLKAEKRFKKNIWL
jgi:hypothetical protein